MQGSAACLDAVGEPAQPRPARKPRAGDTVVDDLDPQRSVLTPDADLDRGGLRVLRNVCERLGCDEVRSQLDLGREALLRRVDRYEQSRPAREPGGIS